MIEICRLISYIMVLGHISNTHISNMAIHLFSTHAHKANPNKTSVCSWTLDPPILIPPQCQALVTIQCVQIPHSFYTFHTRNNTLKYLNDGVENFVTIHIGNYNVNQLMNHINALQNDFVLTIGNPNILNKFFMNPVDDTHTITVINNWELLGFKTSFVSTGAVGKEADRCYHLSGLSSILIQTNIPVSNLTSYNMSSSMSVLARIPISCSPGETIAYNQQDSFNVAVNSNMLNQIKVKLTDLNHVPIELSSEWDMTILLGIRSIPKLFKPIHLNEVKDDTIPKDIRNLQDLDIEETKLTDLKKNNA